MNFRNAERQDLARIVEIYNSTIPSRLVTADTEFVTVESRLEWFDAHSSRRRPLWVIENHHLNIIGWVSFQSFYGRAAYDATAEISIYLDENERGKGLGQQVLAYALDQSGNFGIRTLLGFIFAHNLPSLRLFTKMGFQEWGHLKNVAELDGIERSLKILGKRIGSEGVNKVN